MHCDQCDLSQDFLAQQNLINGDGGIYVNVIYTNFCFESALRSGNANAGFRMPLSVRVEATADTVEYTQDVVQPSMSDGRAET